LNQLLYLGLEPVQECNRFDVMGLREHIKCRDGAECVLAFEQFTEVTREGCGVARDIGDALWPKGKDAVCGTFLKSGARRVQQHEVNRRMGGAVLI
jgi:hypothetical protein